MDKVRLAVFTEQTRPYWWRIGTVEGMIGDDVLVRFGDQVVQVPPEWVESGKE